MTNERVARLLKDMAERRGEYDFAVTDDEFQALTLAAERLRNAAEPKENRIDPDEIGQPHLKETL